MAHLGVQENEPELVRNMLLPTATFIRQAAVAHNGLSQRLPARGRTDCLATKALIFVFSSGFVGEHSANVCPLNLPVQAGVQLPQVHMPDRRRDDRGDGGRAVVLPKRVGGIIGCYF